MNRVMLKEGLIDITDPDNLLLAGKCKSCGSIYFPQRDLCLNCYSDKLETIKLNSTGTLYTYTIVNMPAEHYAPPYAIGWVEFPGGVRAFGQIRKYDRMKLKVGMPVKAVADVLWTEGDKEIVAYVFEPLS
jgi:uncharacterized protein